MLRNLIRWSLLCVMSCCGVVAGAASYPSPAEGLERGRPVQDPNRAEEQPHSPASGDHEDRGGAYTNVKPANMSDGRLAGTPLFVNDQPGFEMFGFALLAVIQQVENYQWQGTRQSKTDAEAQMIKVHAPWKGMDCENCLHPTHQNRC